MMPNSYETWQKNNDERGQSRFLDEWIFGVTPSSAMAERGIKLNIDILQPYRVAVVMIADDRAMIDGVNRCVQGIMESERGIFTKAATKMICLFRGAELCDETMLEKAQLILDTVEQEFGVLLHIGISGQAKNIYQAYQQASKAVRDCSAVNDKRCCFYDLPGLGALLSEIPQNSKAAFVRRMFRGYSENEIPSLVQLLRVYFDSNGSISETSDLLFIHKNTLQYKLKKFYEKTGYDPRNISDSALIYLALQFIADIDVIIG